jgi:Arm DNA-binding domain
MPKITAKFIESGVTFPTTGQLIIRDDELKGFGLRVTKGRITFVAECWAHGKRRRVTLGRYGSMTPDEARKEARKLLSGQIVIKKQPFKTSTIKLNDVFQKFLVVRKLRPNTIRNYTQITKRCLGDWLELPVTSITKT